MRFRKDPVIFDAVQWTGDNLSEMKAFVGVRVDNDGHRHDAFNPIGTYLVPDFNEGATAELWVEANRRHLPLETGEWVIKDELGFYPCKDEIIQKNNTMLTPEMEEYLRKEAEPRTFQEDLVRLLNHHSMESTSGTPDWILGEYIRMSLQAWELGVRLRSEWRGEDLELPALQRLQQTDEVAEKLKALVADGVIHLNPEFRNTDLYSELKPHVPDEDQDRKNRSAAFDRYQRGDRFNG